MNDETEALVEEIIRWDDTTATVGPLQPSEHEAQALTAAAREALTGLADRHEDDAALPGTPEPIRQGLRLMAQETRNYRDHHHP
ncbi:hypothetical protein [Brachybacterium tyrofermentans]|uniref:hypothetical protein n=1 Tax=Brachybacterium tyrofermentans TaxID=47848 RepID=UPI0018695F7C|nr:hypothetical protein [Brachybacterium tyrofermentans]